MEGRKMASTAIVVMNRGADRTTRPFYLRIEAEDGSVKTVDLPNCITVLKATNSARRLGYDPKRWFEAEDGMKPGTLNTIYW